jgi:hypothetical protein
VPVSQEAQLMIIRKFSINNLMEYLSISRLAVALGLASQPCQEMPKQAIVAFPGIGFSL